MKSSNEILNIIICRFPDQENNIKQLFDESDSFGLLCRDYYDCIMMLEKLKISGNKQCDILKEYQILVEEIEDEILERILN